ncbi:MAG: DUF2721 domain-containing protein [Chloroflexi bacterium AL-W]|nr:DUF2721 domain-containing protein [Chloroflexi bacterium AL-N1]NOK67258.1 DUF2721 domain-containing protein [Chloroflexi bacterium AL-N10]NOK75248.1 DUF2721 domain-containing protein [Chloroflexi bacterium AL-N5]NOK82036.1 DUF2721 domain-containing protein [Chloroflexi bacterium AL-W]NOK89881.1 DUF2721 domain-containing protein [Chloroflexi bacterium AL-N15]
MELDLTTPALLFPAISLLLLAYTNRFLALATLMRNLYQTYQTQPEPRIMRQLKNLRYRIRIIKYMQICGVASFFGCVLCMFMLFAGDRAIATWFFGGSLILLLISLALSLLEVQISIDALLIQLSDLDTRDRHKRSSKDV